MKILKKSICLAFVAVMLTACQASKEKLNEQIKVLEKEMSTEHSAQTRERLLVLCQDYVSKYPKDSLAPEYLFKAGTLNVSLRKGEEALSNFVNLINRYPKSEYIPQAYYYIAFVYEDVIYDIIAAEAAYTEFIERYPNHKLAEDAKLSIRYLGKSPEDIIASFEQMQNDSITN